jgi:integrase
MASAMLENEAPILLIQELLGHSSPTVTRQVYAAYEQRATQGVRQVQPADL